MEKVDEQLLENRDEREEHCPGCEAETTQYVTIHMLQEGDGQEANGFSRNPYRLSYCGGCDNDYGARISKGGEKECLSADGPFDDDRYPVDT